MSYDIDNPGPILQRLKAGEISPGDYPALLESLLNRQVFLAEVDASSTSDLTRETTLQAAAAIVGQGRQRAYGTPENNFREIAARWSLYLDGLHARGRLIDQDYDGVNLTATDVAIMMIDVKMARVTNTPRHADSWIDIAGYAACGAEVAKARG